MVSQELANRLEVKCLARGRPSRKWPNRYSSPNAPLCGRCAASDPCLAVYSWKSPASSQWCGRMAVSHSVKERTISENSLIILLQGLQGQVTTVDLRDESVARGRIDNVDAFMNIRLAQVTYTDRWGHQVELDDLFVMGRNVRYVHIPDDVNITATIERQLQVIHRVRNFGGMGRREFPSKNSK
ncbi:U7 snRNA-associated Sm-like protein LSm10 isoform X2 [Sus scrofa]|uniref:U7 snRNA-associated Sm-like protein LSm10 isoform X2 n=1 Tax=Sus scrofa TaxID=9823 RepID=UPI000A2B29CA|nr:U7 snRNA-associated Sm-like protein LSm10 isoform X2 [Sus scrofa]